MRVISQDGTIDIPYENSSLSVFCVGYVEPKCTLICCRNSCLEEEYKPGKVRKQAGGYMWKLKESEVM